MSSLYWPQDSFLTRNSRPRFFQFGNLCFSAVYISSMRRNCLKDKLYRFRLTDWNLYKPLLTEEAKFKSNSVIQSFWLLCSSVLQQDLSTMSFQWVLQLLEGMISIRHQTFVSEFADNSHRLVPILLWQHKDFKRIGSRESRGC